MMDTSNGPLGYEILFERPAEEMPPEQLTDAKHLRQHWAKDLIRKIRTMCKAKNVKKDLGGGFHFTKAPCAPHLP